MNKQTKRYLWLASPFIVIIGWELMASLWLSVLTQSSFSPFIWVRAFHWWYEYVIWKAPWWRANWYWSLMVLLSAAVPTALLLLLAWNLRPMARRAWKAWYTIMVKPSERPWDGHQPRNTHGGARFAEGIGKRMRDE